MIRSWLFVPGDSPRKFERAMLCAADALILDLEDSVAPENKEQARSSTRSALDRDRCGKSLFVRVNALDSGHALADLDAVMPGAPDGIVLPKCSGARDLERLSLYLDAFEAVARIAPGSTRIVAIATETPLSLFALGEYRGVTPRLCAMMWGAEDLAAALGALRNRVDGEYLPMYQMARNLCLAGAAAAGVDAIDTVSVDVDDLNTVAEEASKARRDGFSGKAVIHPAHVDPVNAAFVPTAEEIDRAKRVIAAFEEGGAVGVARLDGKMIDQPHLKSARRIVALANARTPTS